MNKQAVMCWEGRSRGRSCASRERHATHPIARDVPIVQVGRMLAQATRNLEQGHVRRKVRSCGQLALTTVVSGRFSNEYMSAVLHARGGDHMWIRFTILAVVQNVLWLRGRVTSKRCTFELEVVFFQRLVPVRSSKGQQYM